MRQEEGEEKMTHIMLALKPVGCTQKVWKEKTDNHERVTDSNEMN